MLRENLKSELFTELSHKQQQFVAGGAPTFGVIGDFSINLGPPLPGTAGPLGPFGPFGPLGPLPPLGLPLL